MSSVPSAPLLRTAPAGAHHGAVGGVTLRFEKNRDRCLETRPYFCFIDMVAGHGTVTLICFKAKLLLEATFFIIIFTYLK